MLPFLVLIVTFLMLRGIGGIGVPFFNHWHTCLRFALALMFLLTASGHWGKRRPDLIRMVPPFFSRSDLLVTLTGILEILGAIGLIIPSTSRAAAACLFILLLAMFPANVYAARHNITLAGKDATPLLLRSVLQIVFLTALAFIAWPL